MPSIGALPAVPSAASGTPGFGEDIGQALGQMPLVAQQIQLAQAQGQDQLSQLAQNKLSKLAMMGSQKPEILNDPRYERAVEQVYKQMGMPVPRTQEGQLDIQAMLPEAPPDVKQKALGLPPGPARDALLQGYRESPDMKNAPMATSLSPAMVNASQRTVANALTQLGQGKITPKEYLAVVNGQKNTLGDSVNAYLDPDILSDTLGDATQANIAKMSELGIHLQNMDAYKNKYLGYLKDSLSEKTRVDTSMMAYRAQQLANASQSLQIRQGQLQVAIQNAANASTRTQLAMFTTTTGPILKEYDTTLRLYNQTLGQIQSGANAGQPVDQKVLDQATALKQQLDAMGPMVTQAKQILGHAPGNAAAAATGMNIQRTTPYGSAVRTGMKNGRRVTQYSDGTIRYDDGTVVQ